MSATLTFHELPNGLRVICETMPGVNSAAVAFYARTGSRHETPPEHGVSHFLEHMCFKGTPTRTALDINVRFDELGSIYNAFTGKEHTVYYGWAPADRMASQTELLADMMRPSLPPDEFDVERQVVLEEIAMTGDSFEHVVSDFLHQVAYDGHPLRHEILGEQETIAALPRETMLDYHRRRYAPENLTFLATGAIDAQAVLTAVGRFCGDWPRQRSAPPPNPAPPPLPQGRHKLQTPQFKQQSLILAYPAPAAGTADEETVDALTTLMGGQNSRCYWNIVQKGICSDAGAVWLAYADCGMLAFYADGEPQRCEQMLDALRGEIRSVMRDGFSPAEVARIRNRRRTQLAIDAESPRTRLMQLVDDLDSRDRVRRADAHLAAAEAVTAKGLRGYLRRFPLDGEGLLLSVGPRDWLP